MIFQGVLRNFYKIFEKSLEKRIILCYIILCNFYDDGLNEILKEEAITKLNCKDIVKVKKMDKPVKYIDLRWEEAHYIKLE